MAKQVYLGNKIRRLRQREGWTQANLAHRLRISASYLNLIEHNKRSLTVALLFRLAQVFDVDLQGFAEDDEGALTTELSEIFADAVFGAQSPTAEDIRDLASHAPAGAHALLSLYRAYRALRDDAQALAARLSDGSPHAAPNAGQPAEEVSDLIEDHRNHFPELEQAADRLWQRARLEPDALKRGLADHLQHEHGVRVEIAPIGDQPDAVRLYRPKSRVVHLSEMLPHSSLVFQIAHQLALLELDAAFDAILKPTALSSTAARGLAKVALANYFAGAVMMPYERFLASARAARYDTEILQQRFHASFEQVCHRLTTLSRQGASGVPFHFVRIDIAGNISKRFNGSGIRIARYSGACPRWNVHTAFMSPGQIQTQVSRMSDGAAYFCIARTVRKGGGGHRAPQSNLAVGLGCRLEHARELVYADGVDLGNLDAAVPIGVSCRICERLDCRQRAFPPLHHRIEVDPNRRGLSFYCQPGEAGGGA